MFHTHWCHIVRTKGQGRFLIVLALFLLGFNTARAANNGKIAFSRLVDGNSEIFSINPNGTGLRRLTFDPEDDDYPVWSPDGTEIAYLGRTPLGEYVIKVMSSDGRRRRVVTSIDFDLTTPNFCGEGFSIAWSPDGGKIAFQETANIVSIDIDGTNRTNITNAAVRESEPMWAADGLIVYASTLAGGDGIHGLDIHTTIGLRYGNYGYITCSTSPDWSPDGSKLVYMFGSDTGGLIGEITVVPTRPPPHFYRGLLCCSAQKPRWSPDSRQLVYSWSFHPPTIEIIDEFGNGRRMLTRGENPSWGVAPIFPVHTRYDFDGDERTDISVFRPADATWYLNRSTAGISVQHFGETGDRIVSADYDGDGRTDVAVFRPSTGLWYLLTSGGVFESFHWGEASDIPLPGDFDGDGKADIGVFRPSTGDWFVLLRAGGVKVSVWGVQGDIPLAGDFDADGKADLAVWRPSDGNWYLNGSTSGISITTWGVASDKVVNADYDGDGRDDLAVWRPSTGEWFKIASSNGDIERLIWGVAGDIPVPGDYDGDGKADIAVFRPSDAMWYMFMTFSGIATAHWGANGDIPVPAAAFP